MRNIISLAVCGVVLTGCGGISQLNPFGAGNSGDAGTVQAARVSGAQQVAVNRYLWAASLDVLSFLPIETVDPFTGVIITGFGTPPEGSRAYKATVHVRNAALTAQSLSVALTTRTGSVSTDTTAAIEDAILTRARQLRLSDQ